MARAAGSFGKVATALRSVMLNHAKGMIVAEESENRLVLHAPFANPLKPKEPMWFGMVSTGKAYVGYHLMPLYMNARLSALVTPRLKKRMQGKSCFNFTNVDDQLFEELGELTVQCTVGWEKDVEKALSAYKKINSK